MRFPLTHTHTHTHLTNDVRDCVSSFDTATALRVDPQGHVDVGEALLVWVVLRIFGQSLGQPQSHREQTGES